MRKSEMKVVPNEKDGTVPFISTAAGSASDAELKNKEGQLSVDVFQSIDEIVIVAPIAGVKLADLAITITDEMLEIRGKRDFHFTVVPNDYFTQECFWGNFSRSIILPEEVDSVRASANFKNGILTVRVPKMEKVRTRMVRITTDP